jgi:hypothetical protein
MKSRVLILIILFMTGILLFSSACTVENSSQEEPEAQKEITQEELTAAVPELKELHEVVYPLWHSAYPEKDYALIKELLPQAESMTAKLDAAKLPGILRDKQKAWDQGKEFLRSALNNLKKAVESDDEEEMLKQLETFHTGFERLVRTIYPMVSELESFHQELYKLYHYHAPDYNLEEIRADVKAMQEKLGPVKQVQLPNRLSERQSDFDNAVLELEIAVNELAEAVKTEKKETILELVEKVHAAYQKTAHIFE